MLDAEIWPVHEYVFLDWMAVQVDVQIEPFFVFEFEFFGEIDQEEGLREGEFAWLVECAIQILPEKTGAVVACHYSVRVQHGQHVDDVVFSELLKLCLVGWACWTIMFLAF